MAGEVNSTSSTQIPTVPEIAVRIADTLDYVDLENAIELADSYAPVVGRDPDFLMTQGAGLLIRSRDPVKEARGLDWIAQQAINKPDPIEGDSLAYQVSCDADDETRQPNFRRRFEIAVSHFRLAATADGFVPTPRFLDQFNSTIARIKKLGFNDLSSKAVRELAPVIVTAAFTYEHPPTDQRDENIGFVRASLELVASEFRESNPEITAGPTAQLSDAMKISVNSSIERDSVFTDCILNGNFDEAYEILAIDRGHLIQKLWPAMQERLIEQDGASYGWGNEVLDLIVSATPDYFSKYAEVDDDAADFMLGQEVGIILGLLGRTDIIDTLIIPQEKRNSAFRVAGGIAYGFGVKGNNQGYDHLAEKLPHYDERHMGFVTRSFDNGQRESVRVV